MTKHLLLAISASLFSASGLTASDTQDGFKIGKNPAKKAILQPFRGHSAAAPQKSAAEFSNSATKSMGFAADQIESAAEYGEMTPLIEEDFSLLTTGTEENPDMATVLNYDFGEPEYEYVWNNMRPEFVHGNLKWGIGNAYSAGGCVCFPFSRSNPEAHIVTPMMDLTANDGTFVVEFRAKAAKDSELMVLMVEASETRNWGPTWDNFDEPHYFTTVYEDWKTYRVIFQKGGPTTICNIYAAGMSGALYIDDVKIFSLKPYVKTPVLKRHTEFTQTSFKANWEPVEGADSYLLNVWSKDADNAVTTVLKDQKVDGTSCEVTGLDECLTYFYDVTAVKGDKKSLLPHPREVFDIVAPEMLPAAKGDDGHTFTSRVKPVASARGYNFTVMAEREAAADGPFVITDEQFTGWKHPNIETDQPEWDLDNPYDRVASLWYPTDIKQQGWYGENFMTYKDFLCLDPYFYEMSGEQAAWISPEFDLSKDGGKISVDLKLAGKTCQLWDEDGNPAGTVIADCLVGLFNWNDELADYEQVELVRCSGVTTSWKQYHVDLTKGSKRSIVAFFAVKSLDNLYIDDILIKQNYKAGEKFRDPFAYRTWLLADQITADGGNPEEFTYSLPQHAWDKDIYNKAQAARIHFDDRNNYDGEAISGFSASEYVGNYYSSISPIEGDGNGKATVQDGKLCISNPDHSSVYVYTADGKMLTAGTAANITMPAVHSTYIVRIGNKKIKLTY